MNAQELEPISGELVPASEPRTLFRTNDPVEVLAEAHRVADAFKHALDSGGMVQRIAQSEHVKIDGWQTLGGMLGVAPYVVWSRRMEDGWEARAEARTVAGAIVGAAEAMCTRGERNWRRAEDYAIRSMAQTRAMSKALAAPLRFIVTLAGASGTPAEEVDSDDVNGAYGPEASPREHAGMTSALQRIYGADYDHSPLVERLIADADDYLPKIVARALMFTAAHRPAGSRSAVESPGGAEDGLEREDDAPSDGGNNAPDEAAENGSNPVQEKPPDQPAP